MLFGARLTSVGVPGGHRNDSSKQTFEAPAAPTAVADTGQTHEDVGLTINVLANDRDPDGGTLIITDIDDGPLHGTVTIAADGKTLTYTPSEDYSGSDSFVYCISNGVGGTDFATVTLDVIPVADAPAVTVEVLDALPTDAVNLVRLKVTADQTDLDGSEFIDRIEFSGIPSGVTLTTDGQLNDPLQPDSVTEFVTLLLPPGQDFLFNLGVTAFSQEEGNGDLDEAPATEFKKIELDFNHNFRNASFFADNQNLWGPGPAFSFHKQEFIGLDETFDPPRIDFPIPPTPILLFGDASVDAKVGFDFEISITGGEFDATIPFDVTLDTTYNKTTAGATIDGTGPGGFLRIQPIFDADFQLTAGLNLIVTDLNLVNIHQRVNPSLPGLTLDTGDAATTIPLFPGFSLGLDFPELNPDAGPSTANPLVAHASSDNFVQINLDVDAFAANFFPLLAALSVPIPFFAGIPLVAEVSGQVVPFDADVTGGLNLLQDLSMRVVGLMGTLTFEDGSKIENFSFGTPLPPIEHASTKNVNGNDTIDFSLTIMPIVNVTNNTDININIGLSLELLNITGTFSPIVGDDSTFDESLVDFHEQFDIASFPVFHSPAFDLSFASQDFMLLA
jgi:hypothetical protein